MTYSLETGEFSPIAQWILDDTAPFDDHSGRGFVGTTKSGSTINTTAAPVVSSAAYSAVFDNAHQAQFQSPIYRQGNERTPWAMEAWVYPLYRRESGGLARTNLITNPSFEVNGTGWPVYGTGSSARVRDNSKSVIGAWS